MSRSRAVQVLGGLLASAVLASSAVASTWTTVRLRSPERLLQKSVVYVDAVFRYDNGNVATPELFTQGQIQNGVRERDIQLAYGTKLVDCAIRWILSPVADREQLVERDLLPASQPVLGPCAWDGGDLMAIFPYEQQSWILEILPSAFDRRSAKVLLVSVRHPGSNARWTSQVLQPGSSGGARVEFATLFRAPLEDFEVVVASRRGPELVSEKIRLKPSERRVLE